MRYLKLLIILLVVYASKQTLENTNSIPLVTHTKMQQDFELILGEAIITALPSATEITFNYIRSKILSDDEIEILFSTSFIDPQQTSIKIILEGKGQLNRIYNEENEATKKWSLDSFELGDEQIEFQKEIIIEVDRSNLQ